MPDMSRTNSVGYGVYVVLLCTGIVVLATLFIMKRIETVETAVRLCDGQIQSLDVGVTGVFAECK